MSSDPPLDIYSEISKKLFHNILVVCSNLLYALYLTTPITFNVHFNLLGLRSCVSMALDISTMRKMCLIYKDM